MLCAAVAQQLSQAPCQNQTRLRANKTLFTKTDTGSFWPMGYSLPILSQDIFRVQAVNLKQMEDHSLVVSSGTGGLAEHSAVRLCPCIGTLVQQGEWV